MIFFYILVFGMPLVNQPLFASFLSDLTIAKYMGAVSALYAVYWLIRRSHMPAAMHCKMLAAFIGFYLIALVSHFTRSLPVPWELSPFLSLTSFLVLYFIVAVLVDEPNRLRWVYRTAILAVTVGAMYMVREWKEYHLLYRDFRPGFVVGDANYFTLSALLCLPVAVMLLRGKSGWLEKSFLAFSLAVTLVAVVLGGSRGGFVGLVIEAVLFLWVERRRLGGLIAIAVLAAPLFVLLPQSPLARLLHPDYSANSAEQSRLVTWAAGIRMFRAHPIGGVGLGNFKSLTLSYETGNIKVLTLAHNTYIEVAAELGLPGLLLFIFIFIGGLRNAGVAARLAPADHWISQTSRGVQIGLIGCAVGIFFLSAEQQKLMWLMLFITPCIRELAGHIAHPAPARVLVQSPRPRLALPSTPAMVTRARTLAEMFR
ncbi:MAG TPA: O-antigen ligase family protein [Terriglobales bacterium]|jgi:O-antigen ligase